MIDKIENFLEKMSKENLDAALQFEECQITIDDKVIQLDGELNVEVKEK